MGKSSQQKGSRGERELVEILNGYGYQTQRGGSETFGTIPDIIGLPEIHIECKRCEKVRLSEWMNQAVKDSERFGDGLPAVFHRKNRSDWLVTMKLSDWMVIYRRSGF